MLWQPPPVSEPVLEVLARLWWGDPLAALQVREPALMELFYKESDESLFDIAGIMLAGGSSP